MSRTTLKLTAVAFALLYLASVFVPTLPEGAYSDATVLALYADSAARWRSEIAGLALALSAIALLAFVAQALAASRGPRDSRLGRLAASTATVYAVMLMVTATAFTALSAGINVGEVAVESVTADTARAVTILGFYALLGPGMIAAGATVAALSWVGRTSGALPTWCARAGYVVGVLCLVPFWPTQFLPVLWVLCAGFTLDPRRTPARKGVDAAVPVAVSADAPA